MANQPTPDSPRVARVSDERFHELVFGEGLVAALPILAQSLMKGAMDQRLPKQLEERFKDMSALFISLEHENDAHDALLDAIISTILAFDEWKRELGEDGE
jgi:hypothetical protein